MLRSEFGKTWSRPTLWVTLILACLAQTMYVSFSLQPDIKEVSAANNVYAGVMDKAWKKHVLADFDSVWGGEMPPQEIYWSASQEDQAVLAALQDVYFTQRLDQYVDALKEKYSEDPKFDLTQIDLAYKDLREKSETGQLNYGISPAAGGMTDQMLISWTFVMIMMILCVDQFSGEKATAMEAMQKTTRNGRKKLYRVKFVVCQLSALLVWCVCNMVYAVALTIKGGWGAPNGIIQDFAFNACPFPWNVAQHLAVNLAVGLIVSQILSAVMFLLSSISKTATRSFSLIGGIVVLPMLMAKQLSNTLFSLALPCLIYNAHLWSSWAAWRIGQLYLKPWTIAGIEAVAVLGIAFWALVLGNRKADAPAKN